MLLLQPSFFLLIFSLWFSFGRNNNNKKKNNNKNPLVKYWIKQYYDLKLSNHCSKLFERSKLGTLVLYSLSLLKFIITLQSKRNDTLCPRHVFKLEYLNTENSICSAYVQICSPFLMMYFIFLHVLMGEKKSWVPIYRKFEIKKTNQSCW